MQGQNRFRESSPGWDGEDRRTTAEASNGIKFDKTINLGHILTFLGFMAAGFTAWTTLDKRVVVLEEGRKAQESVDKAQDNRFSDAVALLRQQLEKMDLKLDRLVEKRGSRE
jgi:hypothetical protein